MEPPPNRSFHGPNMILLHERLDDGRWQVTGFGDARSVGTTRGKTTEDFLRKLKKLSDEHKRVHGYGLFNSAY